MVRQVLTGLVCAVLTVSSTAELFSQDNLLGELYGRGVHAYFSGDYVEAHTQFTAAIDQGSKDPRCYFFRGLALTKLGRADQAEQDFMEGARMEISDEEMLYPIGRSLERVQGADRMMLEDTRRQARVEKRMREVEREKARFEQFERSQANVVRDPDAGEIEEPDDFGGPEEPMDPTEPEDAFGGPGETTGGVEEPADGGAIDDPTAGGGAIDPIGGATTPDDAGDGLSDPFAGGGLGIGEAETVEMPDGPTIEPSEPSDPFGGGAPVEPGGGAAPADPFGGGAPVEPGGGAAPADPFGGGAAPADPFGGGAAPADPFGGGAPVEPGGGAAPADPFGGGAATEPPADGAKKGALGSIFGALGRGAAKATSEEGDDDAGGGAAPAGPFGGAAPSNPFEDDAPTGGAAPAPADLFGEPPASSPFD
jgi:hypothetical protein